LIFLIKKEKRAFKVGIDNLKTIKLKFAFKTSSGWMSFAVDGVGLNLIDQAIVHSRINQLESTRTIY